jgi:hypothetical protein
MKPERGDLVILEKAEIGQWPPDGLWIVNTTGNIFIQPLELCTIEFPGPILLVEVENRLHAWRMIILHAGRLWWLPVKK